MPPATLPAFSDDEFKLAHRLLAARVAHMLGRKFEEGDWADVYCRAKGIPVAGWSNLNIDVTHGAMGVEHKMLMKASVTPLTEHCGTFIMHPAATRAIRIDSLDKDPNDVMRDVFGQYAALIKRRSDKVRESSGKEPDMRTGWLLWQDSLREFMYFEERMAAPNPDDYRAVWTVAKNKGARLGSKNLWVYDKKTDQKRFSVTTQAGIKIQPYFQVPAEDDPNLYHFVVQGEYLDDKTVRTWVTDPTARELKQLVGTLETPELSEAILAAKLQEGVAALKSEVADVTELRITSEAYERLVNDFEAGSDEQRFRLLLSCLRK